MRILLFIFTLLSVSPVYSQDWDLLDLMLEIKPTDKNAIQLYKNILVKYDSSERFNTSVCSQTCERLGDLYKSRGEYVKAIAYYDSLDLKYHDQLQFCGNAVYGIRVRQKLKVAQCFAGMKDTLKALAELAPYIFHYENDYYCSGEPADFYVNLIKAAYGRETRRTIIDSALNGMSFAFSPAELSSVGDSPSSNNYVYIAGIISLFNIQFAIAHYYSKPETEAKLSDSVRKDFFAQTLKATQIIKNIYE